MSVLLFKVCEDDDIPHIVSTIDTKKRVHSELLEHVGFIAKEEKPEKIKKPRKKRTKKVVELENDNTNKKDTAADEGMSYEEFLETIKDSPPPKEKKKRGPRIKKEKKIVDIEEAKVCLIY